MMVQNQSQMGKGSVILTGPHHTPAFIQPSPQPKKTQKPRKLKRKDTQIPHSSDPSDSLVRAANTASSLEADEDSGNITKTRSKATPNESSSQRTNSGGGPRGNTLQSDEDRLKLEELMALYTNLQNRVLDLEQTKTSQDSRFSSLKRRVKKLEKKNRSRTHRLKRLYKVSLLTARVESSDDEESLGEDASKHGRIDTIDADEEITLVSVHDEMEVDEEVVEVINTAKLIIDVAQISAAGDKVSTTSVATAASAATTTTAIITTVDDITLAQALEEMKSTKPKQKRVVIQELGESTTTKSLQLSSHDKGKGILVEHVKPMKKKDQISFDEKTALKLQAEFDDIQAKIDDDHQLAEILQAQEQEELSVEEKATLFQQLLEKRRNLVEGKEKRAGTELAQEITKKQKVEDDKETTEIKKLMEIIPNEEVAIDTIPLVVKSPSIVDWKIRRKNKLLSNNKS
ncbi:hypothetical protein Tco_1007135 [Tanacetum coccineum]